MIDTGSNQILLGEGLSSKVLLATDTWQTDSKDSKVALKMVQEIPHENKLKAAKIKAYFREESNILTHLKHKNVIEMIAHGTAFIHSGTGSSSFHHQQLRKIEYIAFKLAHNGDLFDLISQSGALND